MSGLGEMGLHPREMRLHLMIFRYMRWGRLNCLLVFAFIPFSIHSASFGSRGIIPARIRAGAVVYSNTHTYFHEISIWECELKSTSTSGTNWTRKYRMPFGAFKQFPRIHPTEETCARMHVRLTQSRECAPSGLMSVYPSEVAHTAQKSHQAAARHNSYWWRRKKYWSL